MLKLIEEPPAKSVFILCTTDYWKIPKTILSRCQRYDFKRISTNGIKDRLIDIIWAEQNDNWEGEAIEFIARQSDGCLRDAITNLDKCIAYDTNLSLKNVLKALRASSLEDYKKMVMYLDLGSKCDIITLIDKIYASGEDMKQFIKGLVDFVLDVIKVDITGSFEHTHLPESEDIKKWIEDKPDKVDLQSMLRTLVELDSEIKWSQNPKTVIEARLLTL